MNGLREIIVGARLVWATFRTIAFSQPANVWLIHRNRGQARSYRVDTTDMNTRQCFAGDRT
jgi:hypothetical protein